MYRVYKLIDPETLEVKWVGHTKHTLVKRLIMHCNSNTVHQQRNPAKYDWIMCLRKKGLKPLIELIEDGIAEMKSALEREEFCTLMLQSGGTLLNIQIGRKKALSTKLKMSEIAKSYTNTKDLHLYSSAKRIRSVAQLNEFGDIINAFESIIKAADCLKIDRSDIGRWCKELLKRAGGFRWKYITKEEYQSFIQR